MDTKIGFVLDNASGLKAGGELVFTPSAGGRYAEYSIGHPPGNILKEGWNGGETSFFHKGKGSKTRYSKFSGLRMRDAAPPSAL